MPCPKQLARIVQRPWGIADLKFFADDRCEERIGGGDAITSGGFDVFVASAVDQEQPGTGGSRSLLDHKLKSMPYIYTNMYIYCGQYSIDLRVYHIYI